MSDYRVEFGPAPNPVRPVSAAPKIKSLLVEVIETILLTAAIFVAVNYVTGRFRIEGDSMEPTMHEGQYVIISKLAYRFGQPQRGDIIVFISPRDAQRGSERDFIKRIVGLPGETVSIADGQVFINDQPLDEPYTAAPPQYAGVWTVGPDQYFVLGDNRNRSSDSHNWGALPAEEILGKAWLIYWPPKYWGAVPHSTY